ncbi:MAG: sigma-70 family RNA polymerase sigma factor [Gemmataceae bacterium]|nr:sigma-70 family RNA polymerase sigma factor [Gemmataceae bacterium]
MAVSRMVRVVERLRRAVSPDFAQVSDGQLLGGFLDERDEQAFALLVRRHGPMVWGVCRRVLAHHQDAEDAFQATFLVLVRKAASIMPRDRVGNWLYGVAYQTALKARALAVRKKAREKQTALPEPALTVADGIDDLQPLLDEELSRLPDKYRSAVVLCELEGKSRKEAATLLGWPEGTVAGRLARARALLAKRLTRRGVALSGHALAAVLAQHAAATAPPNVLQSVIKAGSSWASGKSAGVSATVAALAEGVLKAMLLAKLKAASAFCFALSLVLFLSGTFSNAGAQTGAAPAAQANGNLRDTLLVLDQQYWAASAKHDVATLSRLFANDYQGISHDGTRWTKTSLLAHHRDVRTGDLEVTTEKEVFRLNPQAALLTYDAKFKVYSKSGALADTAHQRLLSCWVQRDGGWFVVFSRVSEPTDKAARLQPFANLLLEKDMIWRDAVWVFPGTELVLDQPKKPKSLIEEVLQAHGGEAKLAGLRAFIQKSKNTHANGKATIVEHFVELPDKLRVEVSHDGEPKEVHILRAHMEHWQQGPDGQWKALHRFGAEPTRDYWLDSIQFFGPRELLRLKDAAMEVTPLGAGKVGDAAAQMIRLAPKPNREPKTYKGGERTWFFDAKTHRLIKEERGELQTFFSDYKEFDGIPLARKTAQKTENWSSASEVLEFRVMDKLDSKLFEKP